MVKNNIVVCEDVINVCKQISDNSIDIIIADPPYNINKDFGNDSDTRNITEYAEWCTKWINEFERILKPPGTGFIYGFSEILAHISVQIHLEKRWLIWHYLNKNSSKNTFWQRSHESIISFWKDKEQRIFNGDLVREAYSEIFLKNAAGKTRKATPGRMSKTGKETIYNANELGAMGRDVLKVPALAGGSGSSERIFHCKTCNDIFLGDKKSHSNHDIEEHPTQKPQALTHKLINSCKPIDKDFTVFIPFCGSGSECLVCEKMNASWISCDINETYVTNANKLIQKYRNDNFKKI